MTETRKDEKAQPEIAVEKTNVGREILRAVLVMIVTIVLLGGIYPLVVFGVGQVLFPDQANGSLIKDSHGTVIGSKIIGQTFTQPQYFWGRLSAASTSVYTATNGMTSTITTSGGSNYGPTDARLIDPVTGTVAVAVAGIVSPTLGITGPVPVDLATASASGLDPDITPAAADYQVPRVGAARWAAGQNITDDQIRQLIAKYTSGRDLGVLGEPRVNVLQLNLALDRLAGVGH